MRKTAKIIFAFSLITLFVFSFTVPVYAQNPLDLRPKEEVKQLQEEAKQQKNELRDQSAEERVAERTERLCENIIQRIDQKITNYTNNKDMHMERYSTFIARLNEMADALEEKGLDVSDLRAAIEELQVLIDDYIVSYEALIAELEETKELACGESQGVFRDAVLGLKDNLEELRAKRRAIKEFYRTQIREVIKDLRDQARQQTEGNEVSEEEEVNEDE